MEQELVEKMNRAIQSVRTAVTVVDYVANAFSPDEGPRKSLDSFVASLEAVQQKLTDFREEH